MTAALLLGGMFGGAFSQFPEGEVQQRKDGDVILKNSPFNIVIVLGGIAFNVILGTLVGGWHGGPEMIWEGGILGLNSSWLTIIIVICAATVGPVAPPPPGVFMLGVAGLAVVSVGARTLFWRSPRGLWCSFSVSVLVMGWLYGIMLLPLMYREKARQLANRTPLRMTRWLTALLSPLRFTTILCHRCLRTTHPRSSTYRDGRRFCEWCQQDVEDTRIPGKLVVMFSHEPFPVNQHERVFVLHNPVCDKTTPLMDISEVYLDTMSADRKQFERFLTYLLNTASIRAIRAIQVFHNGELEQLGSHLANVVCNTFTHIQRR
jgi:hypothetical protein